jgi:hypothetical protein
LLEIKEEEEEDNLGIAFSFSKQYA